MKFTIAELKQIIREEIQVIKEGKLQEQGGLDMSAAAETDGRIDQGQDDARDIASRALNDIERASQESGLEVDDLIQMVMAHIEGQK